MSFITNPLVYYPISGILWFWHMVFSAIAGLLVDKPESNGLVWALAVVFLVVTLRVILFWPMARQMRFQRKMQEMQPKMKALQQRYKNDREKLAVETRKLQKEEGFNPVLGCLPMFIQIPVFLGLFHVLRSFNRMGSQFGALGMSAEDTRGTGNYVFNGDQVQSFLDARLFGAPLSSFISQPVEQFQAFVEPGSPLDFARWNIYLVAVPLMIISALATHFNARQSINRQSADAAANPQAAIMNKLMLWAFPLGILVTGAFWPVAILVYMVVNNLWTFGQQKFLYKQMAEEDAELARERREKMDALAPKVGAKPVRAAKGGRAATGTSAGATAVTTVVDAEPETAPPVTPRPGQKPVRPGGSGGKGGAGSPTASGGGKPGGGKPGGNGSGGGGKKKGGGGKKSGGGRRR